MTFHSSGQWPVVKPEAWSIVPMVPSPTSIFWFKSVLKLFAIFHLYVYFSAPGLRRPEIKIEFIKNPYPNSSPPTEHVSCRPLLLVREGEQNMIYFRCKKCYPCPRTPVSLKGGQARGSNSSTLCILYRYELTLLLN